ncbi:hypothetical protein [Emcibacter nanhaiensis]|uniref:Uncharacterized protein n=1 Tax=Emcibacter nanhaiensis TaxID=1505037 RepID=A0A501PFG4_9PROT|nr:hypothetical protein [Emcibacter nanhaiensis]TPD59170.1 hypothetical protein FIV46_13155 [Emcibacter nanhaiensis]
MSEEDIDIEDYPTLLQVGRFARLIPRTNWFRNVGEPLSAELREKAQDYLDALGFPGADIAQIHDWDEAAATMETNDWNSPWWEAEEQILAGLALSAQEMLDEEALRVALTHVNTQASEYVTDNLITTADMWGIHDEELIRAAAGTAMHCCYQTALMIAAGEEENHPFALKFQLYEMGWWPLGVVGNTFNIF